MERLTKNGFKFRLYAMYIGIIAWSLDTPLMKQYFGLMPPEFWGVVGIWGTLIMLFQKKLREILNIKQLLLLLIVTDLFYLVIMGSLTLTENLKGMLMFESVYAGYYMLVVFAFSNKATNIYLSKFGSSTQEMVRTSIDQNKFKASLLGLTIATLLSFIINVYIAVFIKLILLSVIVYFEIKILKGEVK